MTGCGHATPAKNPIKIPPALTSCPLPPPLLPAMTQADAALALTNAYAAVEECSRRMARLPAVIEKVCGP
ncbi:MAG TPA: hypothetical protein PLW48_03760 [Alphaproteobacteria bacterium]|nr:hypothetical protein [Alphaproteobacteria bacterium]